MIEMDKHTIEQQGIAQKYSKGELSPEETIAFEEYLMDNPDMIEQLEVDNLLVRAMPAAIKQMEQQTQAKSFWWFLQMPWAASFATLLICVILFPLVDGFMDEKPDAVITNIPHVYLAPTRGDSPDIPVISIKPSDRYFELTIQPEHINAERFKVTITAQTSNETLLQLNTDIMPNGDIKLMLRIDDYPAGKYLLSATPADSKSRPELYGFEVGQQP